MTTKPTYQPPLPTDDCQCDLCRAMRDDFAAAALVRAIEHTLTTIEQTSNNAPQAKPEATATALGASRDSKGSPEGGFDSGDQTRRGCLDTDLLPHFLPIL